MEHAINTVSKMCSDLKQMPYYKNYAAASGKVHNISNHEDAVKDVIIQNGFSEFALESTKDKKKEPICGLNIRNFRMKCLSIHSFPSHVGHTNLLILLLKSRHH